MRLEIGIDIGGDALTEGETGDLALAHLLEGVAVAVRNRLLRDAGDGVEVLDPNGAPAGSAELVADWATGDPVWATTREGSIIKSKVMHARPVGDGYYRVRCYSHTGEPMTAVDVDHRGLGRSGEPYLGRMR